VKTCSAWSCFGPTFGPANRPEQPRARVPKRKEWVSAPEGTANREAFSEHKKLHHHIGILVVGFSPTGNLNIHFPVFGSEPA